MNLGLQEYLEKHFKSASMLSAKLGTKVNLPDGEEAWCFGDIPTDKIRLEIKDGRIARIRTYSGLNWNARDGRGSPLQDVELNELTLLRVKELESKLG